MKKIIILLILISIPSFGGGLEELIAKVLIMAENLTVNELTLDKDKKRLEQIIELTGKTQYGNELAELNLKTLGAEFTTTNIAELNDIFNSLLKLNNEAKSIAFINSDKIDEMWDYYYKDPSYFGSMTEMTKKNLEELERKNDKAIEDSRYAIYDAMKNANLVTTLNNDHKINLEKLMEQNGLVVGSVQATQVTNNLAQIITSSLQEIKELLASQTKMVGSVNLEGDTTEQINAKKIKLVKDTYDNNIEEKQKEINEQLEIWDKEVSLNFED